MTTTYLRHDELLAQSLERFTRETADHELTILHDDGLYRHVRCTRPDTSIYRFDLITWPGHLTVAVGSTISVTFARLDDMFQFFRGAGDINPQYWAEKIVGDRRSVERYSMDRFRQLVDEYVTDAVADEDALLPVDDDQPGLAAAVEAALTDEYNPEYEEGAQEFLRDFEYRYDGTAGSTVWRFHDTWEWDLDEWHWSYLWACHAIRWGVARYSAARGVAPVGTVPVAVPVPVGVETLVPVGGVL